MKTLTQRKLSLTSFFSKPFALVLVSTLVFAGCATSSKGPAGAIAARERLTELQSNPELASRVSVAIRSAEAAVSAAEKSHKDKAVSDHLVFLAHAEVESAWAQAQTRYLEDQRSTLAEQRDSERLEYRTREADLARQEAERARQEAEALRREMAELNAKSTDRGMVVTLGDVLFETGKSQLKGSAFASLGKLSGFLQKYPDRSLTIEGHTDSVGSEDSNMALSQRRADAVRNYLLQQGIAANRLTAYGKGENYPVASNDSASGRAMNRRVEVIISNPANSQ